MRRLRYMLKHVQGLLTPVFTISAPLGKKNGMTVMETAALPARRLEWQVAEVRKVAPETPYVRTLHLHVPDWVGHIPGQYVDIRLGHEQSFPAHRSYSIASPPEEELIALAVEQVANGAVSQYLARDIREGDTIEVRGPRGGYFVWTPAMGGPLFLIAGGSGIAPLMAMLRHRHRRLDKTPVSLLYSSRTFEGAIFREEIDAMARQDPDFRVAHTLTRAQPEGWRGHGRRIDKVMLAQAGFAPDRNPKIYICGSTSFVEDVSFLLVELGHDPLAIRTERFGSSGV